MKKITLPAAMNKALRALPKDRARSLVEKLAGKAGMDPAAWLVEELGKSVGGRLAAFLGFESGSQDAGGTGSVAALREISAPGWFGGPVNWWWAVDASKLAESLAKNNATGCIIEFRGPAAQFGVGGVPDQAELLKRVRILAESCASRGLWLWVIDVNANSPYVKADISTLKSDADKLIAALSYFANIIFQPTSERSSTKQGNHETKCRQLHAHYEAKFAGPMVWYIAGSEKCPARYVIADYHVASTAKQGGSAGRLNTTSTDHSSVLAELHGGSREGQTMDLGKLTPFATRARNAGKIFVLYGFWDQSIDTRSYDALGKIFKAPKTGQDDPASQQGSATLSNLHAKGNDRIAWDCSDDVDTWKPSKPDSKGKVVQAWIEINGVEVEQIRPGYRDQHLNNIWGKAGPGEHGIRGIKTGDTVSVRLKAIYEDKATNPVPFVWPFKNT